MSTVILKWNPAVSSYKMSHFLNAIAEEEDCGNWSIRETEKIFAGDRFFLLKVGGFPAGIVAAGTIISDPFPDVDWRNKDRKTFYCEYEADIMINPAAFPLLDNKSLAAVLPDFDWQGGHSGVVLTEAESRQLDILWRNYLQKNIWFFKQFLQAFKRNKWVSNNKIFMSLDLKEELLANAHLQAGKNIF